MTPVRRCLKRKDRAFLPLSVCLENYFSPSRNCRACLEIGKGKPFPEPYASKIKKRKEER